MSSYVPLSSEAHKDKRWLRYSSAEFAKHDNVVQIFANEMPEVIHALPIAFIKVQDRFELVAVMGLKPGENLLVSEAGQWLAHYTPAHYRTRPFIMLNAPDNADQQILCLEESRISEGALGEALFDESGNITTVVGEILKLLAHYNSTHALTREICNVIEKCGIISPWEISINNGDTEVPVNGLYRINETAFNELSDKDFLTLRENGALSIVYGQLFSMNNISALFNLLRHRAQLIESNKKQDSSGGTFNFAGL